MFCWHVFLLENMWYVLGSWQHFLECWLICVGLCGQVMRQCDWVLRSLATTCVCYPSTDSGRVWKRDGVRSGFNGEGNLQNLCWGSSLPFWACDALWSLRVTMNTMNWDYDFIWFYNFEQLIKTLFGHVFRNRFWLQHMRWQERIRKVKEERPIKEENTGVRWFMDCAWRTKQKSCALCNIHATFSTIRAMNNAPCLRGRREIGRRSKMWRACA